MEDARIIGRLRRGERSALARVWEENADPLWSVVRPVARDEAEARDVMLALRAAVREAARGWSSNVPLGCQLAATLAREMANRLGLPPPTGGQTAAPGRPRAIRAEEVAGVVAALPAEQRLLLGIELHFGCPMEILAGLLGLPEEDLRAARASALWRLVGGDPARRGREVPDRVACLACDDLPGWETDAVRTLVAGDPELRFLAEQAREAREVARAVLAVPCPALVPVLPEQRSEPEPLGTAGGVLVGLAAALGASLFGLVPSDPRDVLAGIVAEHRAAVGGAPGFVPGTAAPALASALRAGGLPPSLARVGDGAALRLELRGIYAPAEGPPSAVVLYELDGRPVSCHNRAWIPPLQRPDEVWEAEGTLLQAFDLGEVGVVVVRDPWLSRDTACTGPLPASQLLALFSFAGRELGL